MKWLMIYLDIEIEICCQGLRKLLYLFLISLMRGPEGRNKSRYIMYGLGFIFTASS